MKTIKKYLILLFVAVTISLLFNIAVSATQPPHTFRIVTTDSEGNQRNSFSPGERVKVDVYIDSWENVWSITMNLVWDDEVFDPVVTYVVNQQNHYLDEDFAEYIEDETQFPLLLLQNTFYTKIDNHKTTINNGINCYYFAPAVLSNTALSDEQVLTAGLSNNLKIGSFYLDVKTDAQPGEITLLKFSKPAQREFTGTGGVGGITWANWSPYRITIDNCQHSETTFVVDTEPTLIMAGTGHYECVIDEIQVGDSVTIPAIINDTTASAETLKSAAQEYTNSVVECVGTSLRIPGAGVSAGMRGSFCVDESGIVAVEDLGYEVEIGIVASMGFNPALTSGADGKTITKSGTNVSLTKIYGTAEGILVGSLNNGVYSYNAAISGTPVSATYYKHTIFLQTYFSIRDSERNILTISQVGPPQAVSTAAIVLGEDNIFRYSGTTVSKNDALQRTYSEITYYGRSYKYIAATMLELGGLTSEEQTYYQSVIAVQ